MKQTSRKAHAFPRADPAELAPWADDGFFGPEGGAFFAGFAQSAEPAAQAPLVQWAKQPLARSARKGETLQARRPPSGLQKLDVDVDVVGPVLVRRLRRLGKVTPPVGASREDASEE